MPDIAALQMLPAEEDAHGGGYTPQTTAETYLVCTCASVY